tara:strand:- start:200 stop:388 length:189 start_codon:yes stop_codon:yes gene_type:complete
MKDKLYKKLDALCLKANDDIEKWEAEVAKEEGETESLESLNKAEGRYDAYSKARELIWQIKC